MRNSLVAKKLISLFSLSFILQGCVENVANNPQWITSGKDVVVVFPAWTTENEKRARLNIDASTEASFKCGPSAAYSLIDVVSMPWIAPKPSFIEANILCDKDKNELKNKNNNSPTEDSETTVINMPGTYNNANQRNTQMNVKEEGQINKMEIAKEQCLDLGFTEQTEAFGRCVLELSE